MKWHTVEHVKHRNGDIAATATVPSGSPWFSGHFPDDPTLPGIALIAMVFEVISETHIGECAVTGVKKVRFKQKVKPDDPLDIRVVRNKEDALSYIFEIRCRQEVACTGTVNVSGLADGCLEK